jgi:hypothetical protein
MDVPGRRQRGRVNGILLGASDHEDEPEIDHERTDAKRAMRLPANMTRTPSSWERRMTVLTAVVAEFGDDRPQRDWDGMSTKPANGGVHMKHEYTVTVVDDWLLAIATASRWPVISSAFAGLIQSRSSGQAGFPHPSSGPPKLGQLHRASCSP